MRSKLKLSFKEWQSCIVIVIVKQVPLVYLPVFKNSLTPVFKNSLTHLVFKLN